MAVTIDGSTPSIVGVNNGSSITTGSFSPPANSLLVACIGRFATGTVTMSNTGTSLSWTLRVDNSLVRIYTAANASSQSNITVTFNNTVSTKLHMKVYVVTGHNLTTPTGATGTGTEGSASVTPTGYTSTVAASLGLCSAAYMDDANSLSSSDNEDVYMASSSYGGMGVAKASTTPTVGTGVTFNLFADGFGFFPSWEWAALEIVPPGAAPTIRPYLATSAAVNRSYFF
jgi:hypothetical protein